MPDEPLDDYKPPKPNVIFLIFAFISMLAAVAVYAYEDDLLVNSSKAGFAVGLLLLVLLTLFFMLCFRNPVLGDRVLGKRGTVSKDETSGFKYTGGFKADSAMDEKRLNSSRKSARATRKKFAATQREMDAGKNDPKRGPH